MERCPVPSPSIMYVKQAREIEHTYLVCHHSPLCERSYTILRSSSMYTAAMGLMTYTSRNGTSSRKRERRKPGGFPCMDGAKKVNS